jgi:hypothetical protein
MEDTTQSIKDLWLTGLSGREIAKELSTTRSAVLGKIFRMRASGEIGIRESDMRMRSIRIETKKRESERVITLIDVMRETPFEKEPANVLPIICEPVMAPQPKNEGFKPVQFDKLTPKLCRFVLNDGPPSGFLFCGKERKGRAYCADHEALCYYRIERKGKK